MFVNSRFASLIALAAGHGYIECYDRAYKMSLQDKVVDASGGTPRTIVTEPQSCNYGGWCGWSSDSNDPICNKDNSWWVTAKPNSLYTPKQSRSGMKCEGGMMKVTDGKWRIDYFNAAVHGGWYRAEMACMDGKAGKTKDFKDDFKPMKPLEPYPHMVNNVAKYPELAYYHTVPFENDATKWSTHFGVPDDFACGCKHAALRLVWFAYATNGVSRGWGPDTATYKGKQAFDQPTITWEAQGNFVDRESRPLQDPAFIPVNQYVMGGPDGLCKDASYRKKNPDCLHAEVFINLTDGEIEKFGNGQCSGSAQSTSAANTHGETTTAAGTHGATTHDPTTTAAKTHAPTTTAANTHAPTTTAANTHVPTTTAAPTTSNCGRRLRHA